jgi:hypothetical protein
MCGKNFKYIKSITKEIIEKVAKDTFNKEEKWIVYIIIKEKIKKI